MRSYRRLFVLLLALGLVASPTMALAHSERESQFPPGNGSTPEYRAHSVTVPHLVVCKPESAAAIAAMTDQALKNLNEHLLTECAFEHIQAAVDAVTEQGTNIYVLPGLYLEEPSTETACSQSYDGGVVEYADMVSCGSIVNLITITGDDPDDADIVCDNQLCNLQIEGTGATPEGVLVRGGFDDEGDWRRHNILKADRADGFYLANMAFELARENAVYVHETDGYAIVDVVARYNDLYGILTFTADHGLIKNCETHHNGDSGVYPGSAADVNPNSTETGPLTRYSVEITGCKSYNNALGYSGTAGNSVWMHDNEFFNNGAGIVTDSFVTGHPGMPQDHDWIENNKIYANNENYYEDYIHSGKCDPTFNGKPADTGYEDGVVCPAFQVPVGTGIVLAGANYNFVNSNDIYDNWRTGVMLFWVPAAVREEYSPLDQYDTSNGNWATNNRMGVNPDNGLIQPNGLDFWWDDEGLNNCWQDNIAFDGSANVSTNSTSPLGFPDCDSGGSIFVPGNHVKSAGLLPCALYSRSDPDSQDPVGCDWFDNPPEPAGRQASATDPAPPPPPPAPDPPPAAAPADDNPVTPATGGGLLAGIGLALVVAAIGLRRIRVALSSFPLGLR